jgi:hypothetical protein
VSGTGVTIIDPNAQTTEFRLAGNATPQSFYEFEITVTDNEGATATDRVKYYLKTDLFFELVEIYSDSGGDPFTFPYAEKHFRFKFTPELPPDTSVLIEGKIISEASLIQAYNNNQLEASVKIEKNGVQTHYVDSVNNTFQQSDFYKEDDPSINFIRGTDLVVKIRCSKEEMIDYDNNYAGGLTGKINISNIEYTNGAGDITGFPTEEEVYVQLEV